MSYNPADRRAYHLPEAIASTEAKLARLYAEYDGRRVNVILKNPDLFHDAWEAAVLEAQIAAREEGGEWSIGVDHA